MTANDFPRCATCAHWMPDKQQYFKDGYGRCNMLHSDLEIEIGIDGSIEEIATPITFGCINHSEIKES